jgi:CBS domain-containing protein
MLPLAVLMNRDIKKISPEATLREASEIMLDSKIGSLLVFEKDAYIGVVSETDLVQRGMAMGLDPTRTCVRDTMSTPVITIDVNQTAIEANELMSTKGTRHLAVTEHGKIVGMLSVRDLLIFFKNRFI